MPLDDPFYVTSIEDFRRMDSELRVASMEKFYRNQSRCLKVLMLDGKEAIATNHRLAPQRRAAEQRPDRLEIQLGATRSRRIIGGDGDLLVS